MFLSCFGGNIAVVNSNIFTTHTVLGNLYIPFLTTASKIPLRIEEALFNGKGSWNLVINTPAASLSNARVIYLYFSIAIIMF